MAMVSRPLGNLATQSFEELWEREKFAALRREFEERGAGVDCLNCTIRRDADDVDDDFFQKLAKPAPMAAPMH